MTEKRPCVYMLASQRNGTLHGWKLELIARQNSQWRDLTRRVLQWRQALEQGALGSRFRGDDEWMGGLRCASGFSTISTTAACRSAGISRSGCRLIEAYDRAGFYGYHLAEHHNTPLGYAPSPGIFLSAVAQRTKKLRFGPMVYLLPLYHPLRLIDEICMLDQMSGGRFLYGVGRGISPIEVGFYGVDFETGMQQFREAFDAIRIGLTEDELTYHGKFYDFDHVPIVMKPVQKPYPELWYGTSRPDSIPWAAEHGAHIVTLRDTDAGARDHRSLQVGMAQARPARSRNADDGHQPAYRARRDRSRGA